MKSIFSHTSRHRRPEYRLRTSLETETGSKLSSGQLYPAVHYEIKKTALSQAAIPHLQQIKSLTEQFTIDLNCPLVIAPICAATDTQISFTYYPAQTLTQLIEQQLLQKQFTVIFDYFEVFLHTINKITKKPSIPYSNHNFVQFFDSNLRFKTTKSWLTINPGLIDLTFSNLLLSPTTPNSPILIDQEWQVTGGLPQDFLIFRSLYDLCARLQPLIQLYCSPDFPCWQLTTDLYLPVDWVKFFHLDLSQLPLFLAWENHWQNQINAVPTPAPICLISQANPPLVTTIPTATTASQVTFLQTQIKTLQSELEQARWRLRLANPLKNNLADLITFSTRLVQRPHHYLEKLVTREKLFLREHSWRDYSGRLRNYVRRRRYFSHLDTWSKSASRPTTSAHLNLLIINGAAGTVSQIHRVDHLTEKLELLGHRFQVYDHQELATLYQAELAQFDLLFIHRAVAEPLIDKLVACFHLHQLPVIFDIDDLVFDPELLPQISAAKNMLPGELAVFAQTMRQHRQLLTQADLITCPTQYLANYIKNNTHHPAVTVLPNHLDQASFEQGLAIAKLRSPRPPQDTFTLGYFPGTKTHDQDFAVCAPALAALLTKFPQTKLKIVGDLTLPTDLLPWQNTPQLIHLPKVPYPELIKQYTDVDLNLVPLEENAFCQAKSELKYFFAGICGIPTLATPTQPYQAALSHGGGAPCVSTTDWLSQLESFLTQPQVYQPAARAALQDCRTRYSPATQAKILQNILNSLPSNVIGP